MKKWAAAYTPFNECNLIKRSSARKEFNIICCWQIPEGFTIANQQHCLSYFTTKCCSINAHFQSFKGQKRFVEQQRICDAVYCTACVCSSGDTQIKEPPVSQCWVCKSCVTAMPDPGDVPSAPPLKTFAHTRIGATCSSHLLEYLYSQGPQLELLQHFVYYTVYIIVWKAQNDNAAPGIMQIIEALEYKPRLQPLPGLLVKRSPE